MLTSRKGFCINNLPVRIIPGSRLSKGFGPPAPFIIKKERGTKDEK